MLSILVAVITAPALLGTQEAIRQSQGKEKREEHRARRCHLIASCVKSSLRSKEINGRPIVLKNGKLWIDTGTPDGSPYGHPYAGYYLPYPDVKYEGLVTTITDEAPIMNWVYVDKDTYEAKYGVRLNAQPNLTGPFDCTRQDRRLTFDGWEGWCAVEEYPTLWALYFDVDDNGLQGKIAPGTRVLEIELTRKEKRWKKEVQERQSDQTTKRAVETQEDAPVDKPITVEPELKPPGVVDDSDPAPSEYTPFPVPKSIFVDPDPPGVVVDPDPTQKEYVPFPRPKSIFPKSDPPARPLTPPPAYSINSGTNQPIVQSFTTPSHTGSKTSPHSTREGKRITPKLNRASGTNALAKAQMFEAMSQKSTNDFSYRIRPTSRASDADSASVYSDQRLSTELIPSAPTGDSKDQARLLQPPAPIFQSTTLDPAVFGGDTDTDVPRPIARGRAGSNNKNALSMLLRQDPSRQVPSEPLPSLPKGADIRPTDSSRERSSSPRAVETSGRARNISLEARRSSNPRQSTRKSTRREPSSSRSDNKDMSASRPRGMSSSDRNITPGYARPTGASTSSRDRESRPLARAATVALSSRRPPMGATMTTGTMTSVARRMTPPNPPNPRKRGKTTSSLYRELDDIIGTLQPDRAGPKARTEESSSSNGRDDGEKKTLPLRRAATSRARNGEGLGASSGPRPTDRREKKSSREMS